MIKETSKCTVRVPYVTCKLQPASFSTDRDFSSVFTSCGSDLTFLTLFKGKVMILLSKVFRRLLHSTPFSEEKLQLLCSGSHRSEFQDIVLVCLPFLSGNIFLPMADNQTLSIIVSKAPNKQGILLFVHWKLY